MTLCNVLGYKGIRDWDLATGEWCWVIPGPDWEAAGAAAGDNRDGQFAASHAAVGGRCEHDAAEVAGFQSWYARQKGNADAQAIAGGHPHTVVGSWIC